MSSDEAMSTSGTPQEDQEKAGKDEPQDKAPQDRSMGDEDDDDDEEEIVARTSLCICPDCDKVLPTLKGLFGHYGRTHRTNVDRDAIRYACPFCENVDVDDPGKVFDTVEELESHVNKSHPKCKLLGLLEVWSLAQGPRSAKGSSSPREPRPRRGPTTKAAKSADQQHSHPLCKCPSCDKILLPSGLFGHFGRVHSGQIGQGQSEKFEWSNVTYACPFCPEAADGELPRIFPTYELIESHVESNHSDCVLVKPNASPRRGGGSSPQNRDDSALPAKRSRRSSRYSSMDADADEDEEDEAGPIRKSQRSRRPAPNFTHEEAAPYFWRGSAPAPAPAPAPPLRRKDTDDEEKTLYNCPDCDKTNLTKHGLHAHYGMKHGGKVDLERCTVIKPKASKKKKVDLGAAKTGPWTEEEHAAFLEGHRMYGNRWKRISAEFVPTRDPKQVGSHALNYFTTRGQWQNTLDGRSGKLQGSGAQPPRGRSSLVGRVISTQMDADEDESVSVSSHMGKENGSDSDDGNSSHCIVCFEGGNIVCCSQCPRAYHPKCLAKDGHTAVNIDLLPNDWQCNRCKKDFDVTGGEEIAQFQFGNKKIRAAYADFKGCADYNQCCALLSYILDILTKLKNYDYGFVFSEPVDLNDVPDYLNVVKTPMDYGTVCERLEGGNYVDLIASDDVSRENEMTTMEEILLHVLCDIERVHHNCHMFNKKGSSIYRIANLHASKWSAYFLRYIDERLPEKVFIDLTRFRHKCELELEEERRWQKKQKKLIKAKQQKVEEAESAPLSPPATQRKRKAADDLVDEHVSAEEEEEEEEVEDHHDDAEEDEEEVQRKARKAKRDAPAHASSALLFKEDQLRALENLFFSSAAKLREEVGDGDFDKTDSSPAGSIDADEDDEKGALDGGLGALLAATSEGNPPAPQQQTEHSPVDAPSSPKVPQLVSSGKAVDSPPTLPATPSSAPPEGAPSSPPTNDDDMEADKVVVAQKASNTAPSIGGSSHGTTFQRQWYDRLNELKQYKVIHGTAVVSATKNDKLYHWRLRQRKRYHLTLFRMPNLKKGTSDLKENEGDTKDKEWLLSMPEMKGVFALSDSLDGSDSSISPAKPFTISEERAQLDEETVDFIRKTHFEQLYCPSQPLDSEIMRHSSRHTTSLFWDECLEELRFFQGEHKNTLVPRDFPHNTHLPLWVEIQRARYLLQSVGLFSGLTGAQMLVLEEVDICDLRSLRTVNSILSNGAGDSALRTLQKSSGAGRIKIKEESGSTSERKSWSTHASDFKKWYGRLSPEDKAKAGELLPKANWPLFSWCWRQCNAASAVLCGTPAVNGINMSVKKLGILSSSKLFHAFPYNDTNGLVREDEYEGCDAFDSTYHVLEDFSIKYGSTLIPDWYECDQAFRMWVSAVENGLAEFVRGEPCVLSVHQIEKLILIGFCNDRVGLPNLSRGDVVWLRFFVELQRHRDLFGTCIVSSNFPRLHQWLSEQKDLFRLSRTGRKGTMNLARFKMLMEAGVDFFTGECLPGIMTHGGFKAFEEATSSPVEAFPAKESVVLENQGWAFHCDSYWSDDECWANFVLFKEKYGHSLVLASDDPNLYWWFVEKRGKLLLCELSKLKSGEGAEPDELHSHSILRHIKAQQQESGTGEIEIDDSMFLWLHYCERLMMFKARKGHCKIPSDYADVPLRHWLARQQELIHFYSINQASELLPVQLKILHAIGLHGSKRDVTHPKLSSRTLKRKYPSRKGMGQRRHRHHGESPKKEKKSTLE